MAMLYEAGNRSSFLIGQPDGPIREKNHATPVFDHGKWSGPTEVFVRLSKLRLLYDRCMTRG